MSPPSAFSLQNCFFIRGTCLSCCQKESTASLVIHVQAYLAFPLAFCSHHLIQIQSTVFQCLQNGKRACTFVLWTPRSKCSVHTGFFSPKTGIIPWSLFRQSLWPLPLLGTFLATKWQPRVPCLQGCLQTPDRLWHYPNRRSKFRHLTDHPVSLTGAGR